jgi:hypothetical protein
MTIGVIERAQSRIAENTREIERRVADNARWQQFLAQVQELVGDLEPQPSPSSSPVAAAQAEGAVPASSADNLVDMGDAKFRDPADWEDEDGAAPIGALNEPQPETVVQAVSGNEPGPGSSPAESEAAEISPPVHEATDKSAEPSGSAAPILKRTQVFECHKEHPDWPAKLIAEHLGIPLTTVTGYASKYQLRLPTFASYQAAERARTTEALKAAAVPALKSAVGGTLESRVRAMHAQRPNFTARMIAKELGANLNSVATLLSQIRKAVPAPAGKPEFSSRKEMLEHYGKIAERLGKPK